MKNVYIDLANFIIESKKNNLKINFKKFFIYLQNKFKPDNIYLFTGYIKENENIYNENKNIGYKYIFKDIILNKDENKIKANCDVDISVKGVRDLFESDLKESILISSDGDFLGLINFWKEKKVEIMIISPANPNKCSYLLKKDNNKIIFLNQINKHFVDFD